MRAAVISAPLVATVFVTNAWIAWELFWIEYIDHFNSIEGAFIAIARVFSERPNAGWWPLWHGGMPTEIVYVPGLHTVTGLLASSGLFSAARSYHVVVALAYAAGPRLVSPSQSVWVDPARFIPWFSGVFDLFNFLPALS